MTGSVIQNSMHVALLTGDDGTAQSSTRRSHPRRKRGSGHRCRNSRSAYAKPWGARCAPVSWGCGSLRLECRDRGECAARSADAHGSIVAVAPSVTVSVPNAGAAASLPRRASIGRPHHRRLVDRRRDLEHVGTDAQQHQPATTQFLRDISSRAGAHNGSDQRGCPQRFARC
jgi:hypothetical protein